jgi:hypothetical protein
VHLLRPKGEAILAIVQELSIKERTAYTYLRQPTFQEIQQQGYKGGYASVMRYLQPLQGTKPSIPTGSPVNQVLKRPALANILRLSQSFLELVRTPTDAT